MKQLTVHGQPVKLYSSDGGHTWSSNPQAIAAYGQRKDRLRLELRKSFAQIDEMRDLEPDHCSEPVISKKIIKANKKNPAHRAAGKLPRFEMKPSASRGTPAATTPAASSTKRFHRESHLQRHHPRLDHSAR